MKSNRQSSVPYVLSKRVVARDAVEFVRTAATAPARSSNPSCERRLSSQHTEASTHQLQASEAACAHGTVAPLHNDSIEGTALRAIEARFGA